MKKIFFIYLFISVGLFCFSAPVNSDTLYTRTGWLMYFGSWEMWIPAKVDAKAKDITFFSDTTIEYDSCLLVGNIRGIQLRKEVGKKYTIILPTTSDPLTGDTLYQDTADIHIMPVTVKINNTGKAHLSDIYNIFFKYGALLSSFNYYDLGPKIVVDIQPIRKKDKKQWNKIHIPSTYLGY